MVPGELAGQIGLSVAAAAAASWGFTRLFGEKLIGHSFDKKLETLKNDLARETDLAIAQSEDRLRRETELTLGEASAERAYRFEARKRLYAAIGPLRFQLVQSALQLRERMIRHADHPYPIRMDSHYGQSFLYRLARLVGIAELIERQVAIHDFSVDPEMLRLVCFRSALFDALSDGQVVGGHPGVDWSTQIQHLYRDTIEIIGTSMMMTTDPVRIARFDEFRAALAAGPGYMQPLTTILPTLHPTETPVLWLRMVTVAALADALVADNPVAKALGAKCADVPGLIDASEDSHIIKDKAAYRAKILEQSARVGATSG